MPRPAGLQHHLKMHLGVRLSMACRAVQGQYTAAKHCSIGHCALLSSQSRFEALMTAVKQFITAVENGSAVVILEGPEQEGTSKSGPIKHSQHDTSAAAPSPAGKPFACILISLLGVPHSYTCTCSCSPLGGHQQQPSQNSTSAATPSPAGKPFAYTLISSFKVPHSYTCTHFPSGVLKDVILPTRIRHRGRPKWRGQTVVGLPKKRRCLRPTPFLMLPLTMS